MVRYRILRFLQSGNRSGRSLEHGCASVCIAVECFVADHLRIAEWLYLCDDWARGEFLVPNSRTGNVTDVWVLSRLP